MLELLSFIALFLFFAIILFLVAPILLLTTSIYYTYKHQAKYRKLKGTLEDFWLNYEQKNNLKRWYQTGIKAAEKIDNANETAEKHNLSRNLDGRLSLRSELGKKLNKEIEENELLQKEAISQITKLSEIPWNNWNKFYNSYKNYFSLRVSTATYFISLPIVCQLSEFKLNIQNALLFGYNCILGVKEHGFNMYGIGKHVTKENGYGMLIITSLALLSFYAARYDAYIYAKKITPEPPDIDYDNVDLY
jgi:predicted XRE-type DNA-binding protein